MSVTLGKIIGRGAGWSTDEIDDFGSMLKVELLGD